MEEKLVEVLERFEEAFVEYTKGKESFSLKSDYIEFKYDIVKLLMAAVDESVEFDFENFVEKQKDLPLLRSEISRKLVN
tara:strand:- start:6065 stop:6301 length:237 start_codon:yes stop_codon:yes gene_type:complete